MRTWRGGRGRGCCKREGFEVSAAFFFSMINFHFVGHDWRTLR